MHASGTSSRMRPRRPRISSSAMRVRRRASTRADSLAQRAESDHSTKCPSLSQRKAAGALSWLAAAASSPQRTRGPRLFSRFSVAPARWRPRRRRPAHRLIEPDQTGTRHVGERLGAPSKRINQRSLLWGCCGKAAAFLRAPEDRDQQFRLATRLPLDKRRAVPSA